MNVKKRTPSKEYKQKAAEKKAAAQENARNFRDELKETRAVMASRSGDEARAERIRNKKFTQGVGETGMVQSSDGSSVGHKRKEYKKGGKIYEKGGSVESKKPKYANKSEWASSPEAVQYVAKAMESRGVGFDSARTRNTYMSLSEKDKQAIADDAWSRASSEARRRGSTNTNAPTYRYNFKHGGKIKVNKKC